MKLCVPEGNSSSLLPEHQRLLTLSRAAAQHSSGAPHQLLLQHRLLAPKIQPVVSAEQLRAALLQDTAQRCVTAIRPPAAVTRRGREREPAASERLRAGKQMSNLRVNVLLVTPGFCPVPPLTQNAPPHPENVFSWEAVGAHLEHFERPPVIEESQTNRENNPMLWQRNLY